jgi:gamma-glutamyltranspeptidase / glutathione hydrolase / leukotriene-C4 hydrolase
MVVRLPPSAPDGTSEVWTIDFRETAPAFANATMYKKHPINARFGGLSVGVPGEVRGLAEAHMRWGKLPWRRLVQPSADIASGWAVGKELGLRIHVSYATSGIKFNLILLVSGQNTALCF